MTKSKFKVGDSVYSPHLGEGIVTGIDNNPLYLYPIHVHWTNKKQAAQNDDDIFTPEGNFNVGVSNPWDIVPLEEAKKEPEFKIGDNVLSAHFGKGVVDWVADPTNFDYPVKVRWLDGESNSIYNYEYYTIDGQFHTQYPDPEYDIIHDEDDSEPERDIFLVNDKKDEGVEDNMEEELKIGDWVWLNPNEKGIITFIYPNKETCIVDSELDGEVEAVMAGLTKVEYSPINPSHYQVKGIPEAIDIMKHLMTQEQFKGFLWGNIIKYAYRYGRKGDEHDTAGKIEWYANRLKEVCAEEKKEQERE